MNISCLNIPSVNITSASEYCYICLSNNCNYCSIGASKEFSYCYDPNMINSFSSCSNGRSYSGNPNDKCIYSNKIVFSYVNIFEILLIIFFLLTALFISCGCLARYMKPRLQVSPYAANGISYPSAQIEIRQYHQHTIQLSVNEIQSEYDNINENNNGRQAIYHPIIIEAFPIDRQ